MNQERCWRFREAVLCFTFGVQPPSTKFEFVGKDLKCNRCQDDLESEANVIIHIKSVHIEEVRKMFAIDASEHLEADEEYHLWLNAITEVNEDKNVIRKLENTNRVLLNRMNEKNKDTFIKVGEKNVLFKLKE